ncbi:cobalt dependent X-Pro dipeptidase [Vibrio variabilis]|uniref:Cobalt dependent X-Pro dipeptidase n=1 Tax=Vibrio variabilis TaxID=990271 RepID=A0ABQ0JQP4_9VIBR|nr:cobalt dependent X-Pro dipeptidase [Vibrio variabilis]
MLFNTTDIFYLTGFHFRPSERPIALIVNPNGANHLFVPLLELSHAQEYAQIEHVHSYPEYPGITHPMVYLAKLIKELNLAHTTMGLDAQGYSSAKGYRGPTISDLVTFNDIKSIKGWVETLRYIKSDKEVELIKESARWSNLAHSLLVRYSLPGKSEIEIEGQASFEATKIMFDTLGSAYKPYGNTPHAFYRGQIGPHSAFPHSQNQNARLEIGYNVVSQASCDVWGYKSELERTMFIQDISPTQETFFNHMHTAQKIAFNAIKPGIPMSDVEREVQRYYQENDLIPYTRHHTGHSMGLINHEAPFFDLGDHTILEPGMVMSVEPGLYVEGVGAFRHSDTVVVTDSGIEHITYYPRDLNSLIIGQ